MCDKKWPFQMEIDVTWLAMTKILNAEKFDSIKIWSAARGCFFVLCCRLE